MLEMDPGKRATAQDMLDHPWLEGVGRATDEADEADEVCLYLRMVVNSHPLCPAVQSVASKPAGWNGIPAGADIAGASLILF